MSMLLDALRNAGGLLGDKLAKSQMRSGNCLTHGISFSAVTFEGQSPVCPLCAKEKIMAFDKAAIEKNQSRDTVGEEALNRLGIPPLFFGATFESFEVSNEDEQTVKDMAATICQELSERRVKKLPATHLLFGTTGVGKTHIGCALVRWAYMHHISARYGDIRTVYGMMTDAYRQDGYSASRKIFSDPDLLVLDEVGTHDNEKISGFLQELLEVRYAEAKVTILIGNYQPETLESMIGARCIDRVNAKGYLCHVSGVSRR